MPTAKIEFLGRRDKPDFILTKDVTRLGRGTENDVVFCDSEEDRVVSVKHCEIVRDGSGFLVRDLGSSNKVLVGGEEVQERRLADQEVIQLGKQGPRIRLVLLDAPWARRKSLLEATQVVLRDKLGMRKYRIWLGVLGLLTVFLAVLFSVTQKSKLEQLAALQEKLQKLENLVTAAGSPAQRQALVDQLNRIAQERERLLGTIPETERPQWSFLYRQVVRLLRRFRETSYAIPQIFLDRVSHYLDYYTKDPNGRRTILLGLRNGRPYLPTLKALLAEKKLPEEMAYIAFVESKFDRFAENKTSGARGIWQLMPKVAREYGLTVDGVVDERVNVIRSTKAARGLLLDLISTYGVRSFMLVLAAYNAGDANIRFRLKKLENPIEQRDFWTLVRMGVLAEETNNYIPKFIAAVIVFENLERYGFQAQS